MTGPSSSSRRQLRPTPELTLRQPHRLTVASHDSPSSSSSANDTSSLRASYTRKAELQRTAEKWSDRMMESTLDRATFKRAIQHISAHQLREVAHERHLNSLCSYPLCSNMPARPYSTAKRFVIQSRKRSISEKEGNEEDGFCSRVCKARAGWVEKALGEEAVWLRGKRGEVELMEEVEEGRRVEALSVSSDGDQAGRPEKEDLDEALVSLKPSTSHATATQPSTVQPASLGAISSPAASSSSSRPTRPSTNSNLTAVPNRTPRTATIPDSARKPNSSQQPSPRPVSNKTPAQVTDLLSTLIVHEHPTPPILPIPPSLSTLTATPLLKSVRPASSLLAPTTLSSTVLTAARQMGPVPQLARDSDDETHSPDEEDWERAMGWGEGDPDVDGWFEEARMAREMMRDEGEGT